jgi:lipoprotein-anchoring transpeptidase ErfK/SrfK
MSKVQGAARALVLMAVVTCGVGFPAAANSASLGATVQAGPRPTPATSNPHYPPVTAAPLLKREPAAPPNPAPAPIPTPATLELDHRASYAAQLKKLTPGERAFDLTKDDSVLDPMSWSVMIYKSRHRLVVYYKGRLFKTYNAVFGRSLEPGPKEWDGDRRTPEGVYTIIQKYRSKHYDWFLRLNYPNLLDRERYQTLRADDEVPEDDDGDIEGAGNFVGIHGTNVPLLNKEDVNWTTGCISVDNSSIEDLYRLLPVGTVVIINP